MTLSGTIGLDHYRATLRADRHSWHADEPTSNGGADTAPSPGQLLLGALAACKLITTRMYADRKGWPVENISIELDMETDNHARPALTRINCRLHVEGTLDDGQRQRLLEIADKCPTHRILSGSISISSEYAKV